MDYQHIRVTLQETTERMGEKSTTQLISEIANRTTSLKEVSLADQLLLGAMLGSILHKEYCDDRLLDEPLENGLKNNPRIKELNQELDRDFVKAVLLHKIPTSDTLYVEEGKVFMDIANTDFVNLSPYWQYDNFMAGACAARSIISNWDGLTHQNPEVREHTVAAVANGIHEAWIGRGNVEDWNKDLATAYVNLPVSEQDKDLKHYRMATALIASLEKEMGKTPEEVLSTE